MRTKLERLNIKLQKLEEQERVKSQKFLEKELRNLVELFPDMRVRYEFKGEDYFVEITPGEIYFKKDAYQKWDMDMWDRFEDRFSTLGLCIISDTDDLVKIENVDFTLCGKKYASDHNLACDESRGFNWSKALEGIFDRHKQRKRKHEYT
jgi:hypothetical protein